MNELPSQSTEREWLAKGLQDGLIRQEVAVEIMKILEGQRISVLEKEIEILKNKLAPC